MPPENTTRPRRKTTALSVIRTVMVLMVLADSGLPNRRKPAGFPLATLSARSEKPCCAPKLTRLRTDEDVVSWYGVQRERQVLAARVNITSIEPHLGVKKIPQRSRAGANGGADGHLLQRVALKANPAVASFEAGGFRCQTRNQGGRMTGSDLKAAGSYGGPSRGTS